MAEHISFDTIPNSIRVPGQYIEFNTRNAVQGLPQNPQSVLLLAPMLTSGTQPSLTPVQLFSDVEAGELFGRGSWVQLMVKQAFSNNAYLDLTVIGLPDHSAGVAATGSVVLSGTAQTAAAVEISIGGVNISVAVTSGQTAAQTVQKWVAAINAAALPVTASATAASTTATQTLTLTAKNKGEIGNEISLSVDTANSGLSAQINAMSNGARNADVQAALDKVAGKHYHIIVSPFTDDANSKALSNHLTQVSNAIEQRGAIGVTAWRGTMATGAAFTAKLNNARITCAWYKGAIESNALIAAGYAAVLAFEEDPAKPLNTLEIKGLSVTSDENTPLFNECNNALYNGLTPLTVVANKVQIMRAVSTYTKSATNVDDPSLLDITTIRTLDYVRRSVKERIALRFPRDKLSDRLLPKIRSEILDVLIKLEQAEIIENAEVNKAKLIVSRSLQDANRVNAVIPSDVVNGLHVFAGRIDLIL
ncbi:phage tail sheath subtilisin-like domain-containing protein [Kingella kingae]|uniref:phage tail sheath subtilisin-like domain-containing protein n=1 Tax=Kingella kingae TaxID=504 RepID=UPI0004102E16|nr:phage tail sheath subtilisin-like domain-containing protein [Kingella kingae]MDK4624173.1 phage tail sheath subtilisin-like domain-containing protein [Kingella kingae]MDK4659752.1 phage tail sheath subtilisin-like domain-containing protein [Kingella kingae]MDK4667744.1 phage tail sheath subtilisin-like domain-containing protein [Kingella kingae]MDK4686106.1 phage tail sheath subtilisin-like domain-containing protein [Kingella kingae]